MTQLSQLPELPHLAPRELRLIDALMAGKRNKQIAIDLRVSENTIKVYASILYAKLKVTDRLDLVRLMHERQEVKALQAERLRCILIVRECEQSGNWRSDLVIDAILES